MRKYKDKSNLCGKIIENTRKKKGISREKLSIELQLNGINIDRSHLYRIEKGSVILKDFELILICKILEINFDDLKSSL